MLEAALPEDAARATKLAESLGVLAIRNLEDGIELSRLGLALVELADATRKHDQGLRRRRGVW